MAWTGLAWFPYPQYGDQPFPVQSVGLVPAARVAAGTGPGCAVTVELPGSARRAVRRGRVRRAQMLALGLSGGQVAGECGRRYGLRPRQAWRHARGWSLKEAAEHITAYAAHVGLNPAGAPVAMTG